MNAISAPACMTEDELAFWEAAAARLRVWMPTSTADPCVDCLVPFALAMQGEGRCNGIPGMARKERETSADPGWRVRNRRDYCRRRLRDMGLDPAHADAVA